MKRKLLNPKHYYHEFQQLLAFVITPVYSPVRQLSTTQKISGTWTQFVIKMVLSIVVGIFVGLLYDPENKTTVSMSERFSPMTLFMVGVLILPFLEEVAFRLSMKFKPIYLALTVGVIGYYISSKAIYHARLSDIHDHFENRVIITLLIIAIAYPLFSIPKIKVAMDQFWRKKTRWVFYFFCIIFAWIHVFNYEPTAKHLLLMPLITLPKLVSAFCYGYVRVNYGFMYCFAIHIGNNSIGQLAKLISGGD